MLKIFLTLLIMSAALAGSYLFLVKSTPIDLRVPDLLSELKHSKCVSADGKVYYGKLPHGVQCDTQAEIQGNVTVLDSQALMRDFSPESNIQRFACDGRTRCPEMTSCAEAQFFLNNCPRVQMDGNSDGVPCQAQWC